MHYTYIGGEESTQRGGKASAAFSATGLEKAARSVLGCCLLRGGHQPHHKPFRRSAPRLSPIPRRKRQSDDEFTPHCLRWSLLVVVACKHQRVDKHHETKLELNHHDISLYSTKLNKKNHSLFIHLPAFGRLCASELKINSKRTAHSLLSIY
jgi:hypothetical protein